MNHTWNFRALLSLIVSAGLGLSVAIPYPSTFVKAESSSVKNEIQKSQSRGLHIPGKGSAERKAILGALRAEMKRLHQQDFIFTVNYLKVQSGWSWIQVSPKSADGSSNFENVSALMRKRGGRWRVAEVACAEEGNPDCVGHDDFFGGLRKRFPAAPHGIFP